MIFGYLMMLIAVAISGVAAYYSVAGLTAIFAAATIPVIVMGGVLEAGKIFATVWLHENWSRASWQFKMYLLPAIVFLMFLTSMGIFGFLSKAHLDQGIPTGDALAQVQLLDDKIKIAKENIEANRGALRQMDATVNEMTSRTTDSRGIERANQLRNSQAKERVARNAEIARLQKEVDRLTEERAPLAAAYRKIEAEVGPIKYVAALIYGDTAKQDMLEAAVRWMIILIVAVFDPLALCLILAAKQQIIWAREYRAARRASQKEQQHRELMNDVDHIVEKIVEVEKLVDRPVEVEKIVEVEKVVEVPVEVIREVERIVEVEKVVEVPVEVIREVERIVEVEKVVEVPVEVIREVEKVVEDPAMRKERDDLMALADRAERELAEALVMLEEAKKQEPQIIEKVIEVKVPVEVEKIVEIEVDRPVEVVRNVIDPELIRKLDDAESELRSIRLQSEEVQEENRRLISQANELDAEYQRLTQLNQQMSTVMEARDVDLITTAARLGDIETERDILLSASRRKEEEIQKLSGWVEQLQNDLRAAIQLAQERNEKINEIIAAQEAAQTVVDSNFDPNLGFEQRYFTNLRPSSDFSDELVESGTADFGTRFPLNPGRGDLFLRVDMLPSQLYKWNGSKWIDVDKNSTDRLAYNTGYIDYLIEKLREGVYDIDELNDTERAQIEARINGRTV